MFYSEKFNILVIGIPKTGSNTIEDALKYLDPDGENHTISIGEKKYKGKDFKQGILGHARAIEIKDTIGEAEYAKIRTIAFVRESLSKLVSAYFFTRKIPLTGL